MAKNWWFKLDFKVWRTDSSLRRCSLETRGFWLECLCVMNETDTWEVSGTLSELARLLGCESNEVMKCATELKHTNTADVTIGNGTVTLLSRRLKRELSARNKSTLRVQKHRSNALVTVQSNKQEVISKNKEEREEDKKVAIAPDAMPFSSESQDAPNHPSSPSKNTSSASRGSRMVATFTLTDTMRQWCETKHPERDADGEAEAFRDYWLGRAGEKGVKLDWEATWRQWLRNGYNPILKNKSTSHVRNQPTQREAIEAELKAIEAMGIQ